MERFWGREPDPNVQTTKRESRSFRRIQGADAAQAAEAAARESTPYQKSIGITLRSTSGAKFALEEPPTRPGEAASPSSISSPKSAGQSTPSAASEQVQNEEPPAGITKKLFRKLFRPLNV